MEQCPFCSIIEGKLPGYKVYEDDATIAILDINPGTPGHLLLLPKNHIATIKEMNDMQLAKFFLVARALSVALYGIGALGVNMHYSMGEIAGQRVPHMLLHIVPRYKDDKVVFYYEPKKQSEEELKQMQQKIFSVISGSPIQTPQFSQQPQVQQRPPEKPEERKVYKMERPKGGYWD